MLCDMRPKRVQYIWVPWIMKYDWVHKGHNILREQICFVRKSRQPQHTILTSSVNAIMKAMTKTVVIGPSFGVVRIFC